MSWNFSIILGQLAFKLMPCFEAFFYEYEFKNLLTGLKLYAIIYCSLTTLNWGALAAVFSFCRTSII